MNGSIALIGFMGAGKSHVGMLAAHRLRVPFVDTDALITEQLGPIEAVFAERGEAYFRSVERDVAVAVLERACTVPGVVALGGGAVMDEDVRQALAALAHVVWLTAPVDVLLARCGGGAGVAEAKAPRARWRATRECSGGCTRNAAQCTSTSPRRSSTTTACGRWTRWWPPW